MAACCSIEFPHSKRSHEVMGEVTEERCRIVMPIIAMLVVVTAMDFQHTNRRAILHAMPQHERVAHASLQADGLRSVSCLEGIAA